MRASVTRLASPAMALAATLTFGSQAPDYLGTWRLDVARSSFDPGPPLKSELRTYERSGSGYRVQISLVTARGQAHTSASSYRLDGRPYPVGGNPNYDSMSAVRVSALETRGTEWRGHQAVGQLIDVLAGDGRSRTITQTVTTPDGSHIRNVMVFVRQ